MSDLNILDNEGNTLVFGQLYVCMNIETDLESGEDYAEGGLLVFATPLGFMDADDKEFNIISPEFDYLVKQTGSFDPSYA